MNTRSHQQFRVYEPGGSTRSFTQSDFGLARQALAELNPIELFAENAVKILDDDGEYIFEASELERIDLITDRLSVWDYPSMIGTNVELTEGEFHELVKAPRRRESPRSPGIVSLFISMVMSGGQRYFFWMEVAGGLSAIRTSRICAMIQQPKLVFGLRIGGIGVLNLARMDRFSIWPEPLRGTEEAGSAAYEVRRNGNGAHESPILVRKPDRVLALGC